MEESGSYSWLGCLCGLCIRCQCRRKLARARSEEQISHRNGLWHPMRLSQEGLLIAYQCDKQNVSQIREVKGKLRENKRKEDFRKHATLGNGPPSESLHFHLRRPSPVASPQTTPDAELGGGAQLGLMQPSHFRRGCAGFQEPFRLRPGIRKHSITR